jgi:hypothetical protein
MPKFQGSIFDVDGVLVDSPHEKAWRESLRELMESSWRGIRDRTTWSPDAFTSHVYQQYVSGKPRASGARAALDYFQVPDTENRVAEYAQLKQEMVVRLIQAGDFTAYPDALRFVIATKNAGDAHRGRILVEECGIVPAPDPARHLRAGARDLLADAAARPDAAGRPACMPARRGDLEGGRGGTGRPARRCAARCAGGHLRGTA